MVIDFSNIVPLALKVPLEPKLFGLPLIVFEIRQYDDLCPLNKKPGIGCKNHIREISTRTEMTHLGFESSESSIKLIPLMESLGTVSVIAGVHPRVDGIADSKELWPNQ